MVQDNITEGIIGAAIAVHSALGPGFLESVYQKALLIELSERGIRVEAQKALPVFYKGNIVGDFVVDIDADGILLELKATKEHHEMHEVQLVNYLKATNSQVGLLLNFGMPSLLVKRKHLKFKSSKNPVNLENPVNPVKNSPAFTLLELLVAMAVLSLLVVMMMGLIDSAAKLWRDSENRVDAYREARAALGIIARDLQNAVASTNTNYFLINSQGAFAKVPTGSETDADRAGAIYFLSALPANAQEAGKNKSDVCEVGYFMAFERVRGATNSAMTLNIFRHFRSSDTTFANLTNSTMFADSAVGVAGEELLARNIREFRITPLAMSNNSLVPFVATTNSPMPDLIEVSITAVNQEAAKRFATKADWTSASPPFALTNAQQTFTTRIRLNRP